MFERILTALGVIGCTMCLLGMSSIDYEVASSTPMPHAWAIMTVGGLMAIGSALVKFGIIEEET